MDDEYEQERQATIKQNQELLLSLGLSSNTSKPQRRVQTAKRPANDSAAFEERQSSGDDDDDDDAAPRSSARLSSRPRKSYVAVRKPKKAMAAKPINMRYGTRSSARISEAALNRSMKEVDSIDEKLYDIAPPTRVTLPTLKRLQNPKAPENLEDIYQQEDEEKVYASAPLPTRNANGVILFENNNRHFQPNVTPEEMLRGGIFGGTAFRPFFSKITRQRLSPDEDFAEFPQEWYAGLDRETQLMSEEYDPEMNRFKNKAGQTLEEWENNGWVRRQDPRGWWQWYFRFYLGRRTSDDARQISRFLKACGPSGRFKRSLVSKIHRAGATFDDETISPVVRQTLFHWAYALTEADYNAYLP